MAQAEIVLLTGVSGFLGGHVALALLRAGFHVRGSVRDLGKADRVRATLERAGADTTGLSFVELDLKTDTGWDAAMEGVRFLQHIASPFVLNMPRDPDELVGPAVAGTERAVGAALRAGVERVVLTSSMAAIAYGHDKTRTAPFTEADWTVLENRPLNPYIQSKTRAESRAWQLMEQAGRRSDLVSINPSVILGPLLDDDPGTSAILIKRLLDGSVPAAPRISINAVDVRDVGEAHLKAMLDPKAGGQRYPMAARSLSFIEAARLLRQHFPDRRIPRFVIPDWLVRIYALFDRDVRDNIGELGYAKHLDSSAASRLLGRDLTSAEDAILATAASLVEHRLV
jgi:nucleoside-diphosphate-sugar epimerase